MLASGVRWVGITTSSRQHAVAAAASTASKSKQTMGFAPFAYHVDLLLGGQRAFCTHNVRNTAGLMSKHATSCYVPVRSLDMDIDLRTYTRLLPPAARAPAHGTPYAASPVRPSPPAKNKSCHAHRTVTRTRWLRPCARLARPTSPRGHERGH